MTSSNDLSPVFDLPSAESAQTDPGGGGGRLTSDSYFPSSHRSSFSSNSSSLAAEPGSAAATLLHRQTVDPPTVRPAQPARAATTAVPTTSAAAASKTIVIDALLRTFPKPTEEATLEELLARPPQKWSVGHYVKNARDARASAAAQDKEVRAARFAEAKRELLAAKEAMEQQQLGRDGR